MWRILLFGLIASGFGLQPVLAAGPVLTPDGYGLLKIGMKESDAVRRFHLRIAGNDGVNSYECREDSWPGHPNIWIMTRNGRVSRISTDGKALRTDKGFGVGSQEIDIERAYGAALVIEPHTYDDPPAHYLTSWSVKGRRGVRYETDESRRVTRLHVGDDSIEYVEGCL